MGACAAFGVVGCNGRGSAAAMVDIILSQITAKKRTSSTRVNMSKISLECPSHLLTRLIRETKEKKRK